MPPRQYLLEWRVATAKDILRGERPSMAEVARRVGYQSASAFTTAFTRMSGCSPREYARGDAVGQRKLTAPTTVLRQLFCSRGAGM